MSTRATVHFASDGRDVAIVYRHNDGYPEGLGEDLQRFLREVEVNLKDHRFADPSYLASKWLVWDARQHTDNSSHYLDFLSVGIVLEDPGDIEYRYTVHCDSDKLPKVTYVEI